MGRGHFRLSVAASSGERILVARILITGATGLVGSHLVPLFGADDELHLIVRGTADVPGRPNVHLHRVDLSRPIDEDALPEKIDAIIYLAQSDAYRDFPDGAPDVFSVNVAGVMHLLDYGRRAGATSFVSASTGSVYGPLSAPAEETAELPATGRLGFYASSKQCGEILVQSYGELMNVAVLRLFFAYGPGQKRSMLIPRLVDSVREGRPVSLAGEDGLRINPIHASDAARAFKAALDLEGTNIVHVAGPEILSLREICEAIGANLGREPRFEVQPGPAPTMVGGIARMTELLGPPERRFEEEIAELL
jgi:UDP-glucose 4-epimerase